MSSELADEIHRLATEAIVELEKIRDGTVEFPVFPDDAKPVDVTNGNLEVVSAPIGIVEHRLELLGEIFEDHARRLPRVFAELQVRAVSSSKASSPPSVEDGNPEFSGGPFD